MLRRSSRAPALVVLLLGGLGLSGCTPGGTATTPPPTERTARVFESDEEALAAAEAAYGEYLDTVLEVLTSGGFDIDRLRPFLTPDMFEAESVGYEEFRARSWRAVGRYSFTMTTQDVDLVSGRLTLYVCDDRSELDIVDSAGNSVVAPDRPDLAPYVVEMVWDGSLRIASQLAWEGGGVCAQ